MLKTRHDGSRVEISVKKLPAGRLVKILYLPTEEKMPRSDCPSVDIATSRVAKWVIVPIRRRVFLLKRLLKREVKSAFKGAFSSGTLQGTLYVIYPSRVIFGECTDFSCSLMLRINRW